MRVAIRFNDYAFPSAGRGIGNMRPRNRTRFRGVTVEAFREDGGFNGLGRTPPPVQPGPRDYAFYLKGDTEQDVELARLEMLEALADGPGKLYFAPASPLIGPPLVYSEDAYLVDEEAEHIVPWLALTRLTFQLDKPLLIWPLTEADVDGLVDANADPAETIGASVWGESWDERVAAVWSVTSSPFTFTLSNPGHRRIKPVIRIESQAVDGWTNPKLENLTTGQEVSLAATGSTNQHIWQVHAADQAHGSRLSDDGGSSWSNVWPSTALNTTQGRVMELARGANQLRFTSDGTVNCRILIVQRPVLLQ